jgi:HK97 family phage portal protein
MSVFSRLFKARDKPKNSLFGNAYSFFFGGTSSGKAVNERTAMQTTAVYACVRILAEAIAGLPLHVYRYKEDGGKEKALTHPLYYLLHDEPNPEMTSFVFRETLMSHLLLWGNAYAQIIRDGSGRVLALYPLLPNKMTVDRAPNGELFYTYRRDSDESRENPKAGLIYLRSDEVLHIPGLGFDGLIGYSPIAMAKNAIGMAIACEEYGASFFANGANPGGVLEHPGVLKDPAKVRESWNAVYQGSANAHRIAVLEEGMKFQPIGIPPEQAQFLETRKFQINEIARIFRVPPHMVGDLEKSSFSNIEQRAIQEMRHAEQLIGRILFLGGTPIVSELNNIHIGKDVPKQVENDRAAEERAIKAYNDAIALAGEVGDHATRDILVNILKDEDRHMDELEELLDQIEQMTLPIFLTTKVD